MRRRAPPLRVLLVDDDEQVLDCLDTAFQNAGFLTATARSGEAALAEGGKLNPDAIVLDQGLPDIPGTDLIRRLRECCACEGPVVVLTGTLTEAIELQCLDRGATSCLVKGVHSIAAIPLHVERLLERSWAGRRVEVGKLAIDLLAGSVVYGDRPIQLRPQGFSLLRALAATYPNQASWNDIQMVGWMGKTSMLKNKATPAIMTTLARLKAKLGPAAKHIETTKGGGLRLRP